MRSGLVAATLVGAALAIASPTRALEPGASASLGWPNHGRLVRGRRLRESRELRFLPVYAGSAARWGMPELVEALARAARRVARRFPGAILWMGELSNEHGGPIASHRSHESGRDADIGFYLVDARGRALPHERFLACEPDGAVRDVPGARFDDARNWALVASLLDDPRARVRQIFVHASLRARLLEHAERTHAPASLRDRAAALLYQPPRVEPHDDHFHVRIACRASQVGHGCIDDSRVRARPEAQRPVEPEPTTPAADDEPPPDAPGE